MRRTLLWIGVLAAVAASSCSKEPGWDSGGEECTVTLKVSMEVPCVLTTKADAYSTTEEDDFIDRLDLFEYDKDGVLINSRTWTKATGLDLSGISYTSHSPKNVYRYWVLLANFTEDSIDYLSQLQGSDFAYGAKNFVPLSAGNFRLHKPLMGGSGVYNFTRDKEIEIKLYRYMTKFEIGTVTADFDDTGYFESDVKLKKIAIIQAPNFLRPVYNNIKSLSGSRQDVLGVGYSYPNGGTGTSIGNLETYHTCVNNGVKNSGNVTGTFNLSGYGATGTLAADFPYALNYNSSVDKGVLNLDVTGDMRTAMVHEFGSSEGILCKSDDEDWPHTYAVNRVLYTMPWYRSSYGSLWGAYTEQDVTQKMVFQVEIDGEDCFYIIPMRELEAGCIYKLTNLTLKGPGSEYSNFYERKYEGDLTPISVTGWEDLEISNINMGYTDDLGLAIY